MMMTIDLKWILPAVLPFFFLAIFRAIFWAAGASWTDPAAAAIFSFLFGIAGGGFAVIAMTIEKVRWNVRIGRRHD